MGYESREERGGNVCMCESDNEWPRPLLIFWHRLGKADVAKFRNSHPTIVVGVVGEHIGRYSEGIHKPN